MKTSAELQTEIHSTNEKLYSLEEAFYSERKLSEIEKLREQICDVKLTLDFLKHNLKVAFYYEVLPVVEEILRKYEGKSYGTKTKEKIRDEMYERTKCRLYLETNTIKIYTYHSNGCIADCIEIYTEYVQTEHGLIRNNFLKENKVQKLDINNLTADFLTKPYAEDIPAMVQKVKELYRIAYETKEKLEEACSDFNKTIVGDRYINSSSYIYPTIY